MITQRDVARVAGVERSTVSLALRNHPHVAAGTRERIRRIARELGYQPNPALSALAANRFRPGGTWRGETVAFVASRTDGAPSPMLTAARERLAERGHGIDVILPGEFRNGAGLSRLLSHRGLRGVLLEQVTRQDQPRELEWESFCAVQCGLLRRSADTHLVGLDLVEMLNEAARRLRTMGCRRIGVFLPGHAAYESDQLLWQAASGLRARAEFTRAVRDVVICEATPGGIQIGASRLAQARPDGIVAVDAAHRRALGAAGAWRPKMPFAALLRDERSAATIAGFDMVYDLLGRIAADFLADRLREHAYGLPTPRQKLLFLPPWREGR